MEKMERVNRILSDEEFRIKCREIAVLEKDRIYCKHQIDHFLSVARIAVLLCEEKDLTIDRELIYAAALLHDIGRGVQYQTGERHELASIKIAPDILKRSGFYEEEIAEIIEAIANHRNKEIEQCSDLNGIFYRADKLSRNCFCCEAESLCDKETAKKTLFLYY
ncbi:MAG TPA: HD domain-containing protein [Lachnospiraceae bacterium]|nr:HD domain-containing protein [Lachnospiraceae bacterium]